jgi:hypothetical protein
MLIPLFLCIGFEIAVLYMDLVFDLSALPYRHTKAVLPGEVMDPIATYYRYITRNPYLLMFVLLTTAVCIVAEVVYDLVPRWVGYSSLFFIGFAMMAGTLKVIPTAQRLAAATDPDDTRTRMVHSIFPYHLAILVCILSLAVVQFSTTIR